jgi:hypothetical protein
MKRPLQSWMASMLVTKEFVRTFEFEYLQIISGTLRKEEPDLARVVELEMEKFVGTL